MAKQTKAEIAKEADKALTSFLKKNELKRDKDYSKDSKFGKKWKELTLALQKANDDLAEGTPKAKDKKAEKGKDKKSKKESKGGGPGRATKYEYPEGLTAEEKKEFRVQARKAAKNGGKGETKAKVEKTTKKTKKVEEAPAKDSKKSKDKKKKKKSSKND